ncbi:hypothetical protein HDU99_009363, partial [Rhizoclosmatium hyalinum]
MQLRVRMALINVINPQFLQDLATTQLLRNLGYDLQSVLSEEGALALPTSVTDAINLEAIALRSSLELKRLEMHQQSDRGKFQMADGETLEAYERRKAKYRMMSACESHTLRVASAALDPDMHAFLDLGFTTQKEADVFLKGSYETGKKDLVFICLNGELMATHVSGNLSYPETLRKDYNNSADEIIALHRPLPTPTESSHANKYPDLILGVYGSGSIDNSLGFMNGHHHDPNTHLKLREARRESSEKITGSMSYLRNTLSAAKVIDGLNSLFFGQAMARKQE